MKLFLMITNALLLCATVAAAQNARPLTSRKEIGERSESKRQEMKDFDSRRSSNREGRASMKEDGAEERSSRSKSSLLEGQDKGNGGFLFSRTSKKLLDEAQATLLAEMKVLIEKRPQLTFTSEACVEPIDMRQLESAIANMTYTYEKGTTAINEQGREEEKYFQINGDGKVEATALYFNSFIDTYFRYTEEKDIEKQIVILEPVRVAILHEALHLFQYNESKAMACRQELAQVVASYNDWKLKRLQERAGKENDRLVKENLIRFKCLNEEDLQSFKSMARGSHEYYSQWSRHVLKCFFKINNPLKTEWVMEKGAPLKYVEWALSNGENMDDVSRRLNQVFFFSFEKEIPQAK